MKKFSMGMLFGTLMLVQIGCGEQSPAPAPAPPAAVSEETPAADAPAAETPAADAPASETPAAEK